MNLHVGDVVVEKSSGSKGIIVLVNDAPSELYEVWFDQHEGVHSEMLKEEELILIERTLH